MTNEEFQSHLASYRAQTAERIEEAFGPQTTEKLAEVLGISVSDLENARIADWEGR